jgi:hypothetical protein
MKSIVGLILGLVGAILNLFLSIVFLIFYIIITMGKSALIENSLSESLIEFSTQLGFWVLIICIWLFVFGVLGVFFSSMMNREGSVVKGGVFCFLTGLFSINLFMIIGGLMGVIVGRMDGGGYNGDGIVVQRPIQSFNNVSLNNQSNM